MRRYVAELHCPSCRAVGRLELVVPPPGGALDPVVVRCSCGWEGGLWQAEMASLFELLMRLRP